MVTDWQEGCSLNLDTSLTSLFELNQAANHFFSFCKDVNYFTP